MAECVYLEKCVFFNSKVVDMPAVSGFLKMRYCRDQYDTCARYILRQAEGPEAVPVDMYPNEIKRAQALMKKH
jgi:hypothetical protein